MLVDAALARALEGAIAASHVAFTDVARQCGDRAAWERVGSGVACASGPDSPLSQVVAWGFDESQDSAREGLARLEAFARDHGLATCAIELCPLAAPWLPALLASRGYAVAECSTIAVAGRATLEQAQWPPPSDALIVERLTDDDARRAWAQGVSRGFGAPELVSLFDRYARARGIHVFRAQRHGEVCGGGALGLHDGVGDLGLTSVLPEHRGHGVQRALLAARLAFAHDAGARLASVTTEPGSISDRNVQRAGFTVAYTRLKLERCVV